MSWEIFTCWHVNMHNSMENKKKDNDARWKSWNDLGDPRISVYADSPYHRITDNSEFARFVSSSLRYQIIARIHFQACAALQRTRNATASAKKVTGTSLLETLAILSSEATLCTRCLKPLLVHNAQYDRFAMVSLRHRLRRTHSTSVLSWLPVTLITLMRSSPQSF